MTKFDLPKSRQYHPHDKKTGRNPDKKRWVHYQQHDSLFLDGLICGKEQDFIARIPETKEPNEVTCPRCLEKMKETMYYCSEHGFVEGVDVTNDKKCAYCGRKV